MIPIEMNREIAKVITYALDYVRGVAGADNRGKCRNKSY